MRITSFKYTALTLGMTLVLSACGGGGGNKSKAVSTSGSTTESVNAKSAQTPETMEERLAGTAKKVREAEIAFRLAETAVDNHKVKMSKSGHRSHDVLSADDLTLTRLNNVYKKAVAQVNASREINRQVKIAVSRGCLAMASPGGEADCRTDGNGNVSAISRSQS